MITQIVCGGCGAVKKETNHWFAISIVEHSLMIRSLTTALHGGPSAAGSSVEYYCGQKCVLEAMAQWMDGPATSSLPF
jgi:hypothetical protein